MIEFINSWAEGIILAVIIATIIEIILPNGNNKKYVKTIIGIYILFTIVHPVVTKLSNKETNIDLLITNMSKEIETYKTVDNPTIETNGYIQETYKQKIEEDLKKRIKEKGYNVKTLELELKTEKENFYEINKIYMQLEKEDSTINNINKIEEININVSNSNNIQQTNKVDISEEEINNLKQYISNTYSITEEQIHINQTKEEQNV